MGDEDKTILSSATSLFIQFEPGKDVYYLGCMSLPDLSNPRGGWDPIIERDGKGGFEIVGEKPSAPGLMSLSLERLHARTARWIDQAQCAFNLFALQRCEGNEGLFDNWVTGQVVRKVRLTDDTISPISQRDAADEMVRSYDAVARPPRVDLWEMLSSAKSNSELQDLNCIASPLFSSCGEGCGVLVLDPCTHLFAGADAIGAGTANMQVSHDGGQTWAAAATDPFAADLDITAIKCFMLDQSTIRVIVFRETLAATPLQCRYTDDYGATWVALVNVGSTAAEAVNSPHAFFIWSGEAMWVGTSGGRIYKSTNSGVTWTEQTSALVASGANQINGIDFLSNKFGVAVGVADTVIYTIDGGVNWAAATATGAAATLRDVEIHSRLRWSVATESGRIYMTYDGGQTWTQLTDAFDNAGTGVCRGFSFPKGDEMNGFMIHNTAAPVGTIYRTINGGRSYRPVGPTTGSAGLSEVLACGIHHVFAVGDDDGTRAVILEAGSLISTE